MNAGLISATGSEGSAFASEDSDRIRFTNEGTLQADDTAARVIGEDNRLINDGLIADLDPSSGAAVWMSGGGARLINRGEIRGEVLLGPPNPGSPVDVVQGDNLLRNDGTILGSVAFGEGADICRGRDGFMSGAVSGGDGHDLLQGGRWRDTLNGGRGADDLDGGNGRDLLRGGSQQGDLSGGAGEDEPRGSNGSDLLNGGGDADLLIGGRGADTFVFAPAAGRDRIGDFEAGRDSVDLTAFGLADAGRVLDALRETADGATLLLSPLGGQGRIVFEGVGVADLSAGDFQL